MTQDCPSPYLDEPPVTTVEINTTVSITGTVNTTYTNGTETFTVDSVVCKENGTTIQSSSTAGTISITYTVMEGSVEISCTSTCRYLEMQGKSNVITITGEGEI